MVYQCPSCLGVHGEATEPVVGIFLRCEECLIEAGLAAEFEAGLTAEFEAAANEFVPLVAA